MGPGTEAGASPGESALLTGPHFKKANEARGALQWDLIRSPCSMISPCCHTSQQSCSKQGNDLQEGI